jgi:hypothetical protein
MVNLNEVAARRVQWRAAGKCISYRVKTELLPVRRPKLRI